jgi:phosphoribosylanthranilate isomerase
MRVDVKICGLRRPEDAAFAAIQGVWRLGVVFAHGPRLATLRQAKEIVAAASGIPVMGVFGTQTASEILDIVAAVGLGGAQLHGGASAETVQILRAAAVPVWRVVPVGACTTEADMHLPGGSTEAVLVEARVVGGAGGRGIPVALSDAARARRWVPSQRFVLAGGLTPESVGEAIRVVRPDAVDVSSGIEISPGVKSHDRVARFLENVRAASN